jgi:hypothetical protein
MARVMTHALTGIVGIYQRHDWAAETGRPTSRLKSRWQRRQSLELTEREGFAALL